MSDQKPAKLKRSLDPDKRAEIILHLNEKHVELINRLLATGMWGGSAAQVVMRLFDKGCSEIQ